MAAGVTIDRDAFADRRIARLGELGGYSHMEALGRIATLWSRCTELQTDTPGEIELDACLGDGGGARLVRSGLGELTEDGAVRVRGCNGRIEWFRDHASRSSAGGKARANAASRDQRGRLIAQPRLDAAGPAGSSRPPADLQPPPGQVQDPEHGDGSGSSPSQLPDRGRRDLDRGAVLAAGAKVPPAPPLHDRAAGDVASDRRQVPQASAPDVARNQALVRRFVDGINAARARIALALGLRDVRPISHMHGSEATLLDRIRGVASAEADIDHVIAVKEEEAVDTGDMRWLGWTVCEPGAWRVALAGVPGSRKKAKPIGAPPSSPAKFDPLPPRVEMSEEERAEMSKLALAVAADPNKAARGAKP